MFPLQWPQWTNNDDLSRMREWRERWDRAFGAIVIGWFWGFFGVAVIWAPMTEGRGQEWVWIGVLMCAYGTFAIRMGRRIKRRLFREVEESRRDEAMV
jgi:hypothetical protein